MLEVSINWFAFTPVALNSVLDRHILALLVIIWALWVSDDWRHLEEDKGSSLLGLNRDPIVRPGNMPWYAKDMPYLKYAIICHKYAIMRLGKEDSCTLCLRWHCVQVHVHLGNIFKCSPWKYFQMFNLKIFSIVHLLEIFSNIRQSMQWIYSPSTRTSRKHSWWSCCRSEGQTCLRARTYLAF